LKENLKIDTEIIEPAILKKTLSDPSFFIKIKKYLDTRKTKNKSYFNDVKYQKLFNIICSFFDKFEKVPNINDMKLMITKIPEEADIKLYYNAIIEKIYNEDMEFSEELIQDETLKFIKKTASFESFLLAQEYFLKEEYDKIGPIMNEVNLINFDKDLGKEIIDTSFIDDINQVYNDTVISTGFSKLDNVLTGGLMASTLTLFSAPPGIGKSTFLGFIAINSYLQGKKVLFITLEMSDENVAARFLTNILDVTRKEIINNPESIKERVKGFNNNTGSLIIKEYPANTTCSNDFIAYIRDLRTHKNFIPDIVLVDYLLIMSSDDSSLSRSDSYQYYKSVTIELRNIAKINHIPVVSAVQLNRSAQQEGKGGTKNTLTSQSISESRAILDNTDNLFTIIQTERDKKENIITLYGDKIRNGPNGQRIKFHMDYEHMKAKEVD